MSSKATCQSCGGNWWFRDVAPEDIRNERCMFCGGILAEDMWHTVGQLEKTEKKFNAIMEYIRGGDDNGKENAYR